MNSDEITKRTCRALEWDRLRQYLAAEADTQSGKELCVAIEPADAPALVAQLLEETNEALSLIQARSALGVSGLPQMDEIISRLQAGAAINARELLSVRTTLSIAKQTRNSLSLLTKETFPRLTAFAPRLHIIDSLVDAIANAIDDAGEMKDEASSTLQNLRRDVHRLDANIKDELMRIIRSSTLSKALQEPIYTQRGGRYVLPVDANSRSLINGIVHDSSASGLTVYVEPMAVVELANKMRMKAAEIEHEIARILQELSQHTAKYVEQIESSYLCATELDLVIARARLASRYGGYMPELSSDRMFEYKNARHPLLVLQTTISDVVPNTIRLGGSAGPRTLVITGPNTGGKTVLLKTVGIFSLMIRCGLLPAAAPGSVAAIFPRVCADIGDEQSLEQSLSTFSSHMQNIVEIVERCGDDMLVLLDEVGAGTDPREGAALARAILEQLNASGAVTISTTHYGELKTLAYTEQGFLNGSLEFDEATLSPSYRLKLGVPGSSKATMIARRLGLRDTIVERAGDLMQGNEELLETTIKKLEWKLKEAQEREQLAERSLSEARRMQEEAGKQLSGMQEEADALRNSFVKEIEDEFKLSRDYIKHLISDLQKQPSLSRAQKAQADLEKLRKELGWVDRPRHQSNTPAQEIEVGKRVRVQSLGQIGVVEEIIAGGSRESQVCVRAGGVKIKVPLADLELVDGGRSKSSHQRDQVQKAPRKPQGVAQRVQEAVARNNVFVQTQANTLDLRGQRVHEAIPSLEEFLDACAVDGISPVMIIHGHGTGAVKTAVRENLSASSYVEKFRPGESYEGGDGVTIVEVR